MPDYRTENLHTLKFAEREAQCILGECGPLTASGNICACVKLLVDGIFVMAKSCPEGLSGEIFWHTDAKHLGKIYTLYCM